MLSEFEAIKERSEEDHKDIETIQTSIGKMEEDVEDLKKLPPRMDELDEINMCVEYDLDGKKIDYLPAAVEDQIKIKPIFSIFLDADCYYSNNRIERIRAWL